MTTPHGAKHCKAKFLSKIGKRTPLAARFSTVGGESGSADTARDPRGFALKFYTEEGNWDMVSTTVTSKGQQSVFDLFFIEKKKHSQK